MRTDYLERVLAQMPRIWLNGLMADQTTPSPAKSDIWQKLRLHHRTVTVASGGVQNANKLHEKQLSKMDKVALWITIRVGSMGFFIIILIWTLIWCGYNILATQFS